MKNVATVYCQHGDERFGALIAAELHALGKQTILGNPQAFLAGKRMIESDLNRSYQQNTHKTYESRQAAKILGHVQTTDLVIDVHTSHAHVGVVAILPREDSELIKIAARLGFNKVAIMPKEIVADSLIGNVPHGISLEFGVNINQSVELARQIAERISSMPALNKETQIEIYNIKGLLDPKYRGKGLRNYKYDERIQGYPFLIGESRYKGYAGFYASSCKIKLVNSLDI